MSLLIAYRDELGSDFGGSPWIFHDFEDNIESGVKAKDSLLKKGFKDVTLFNIELDESIEDYLGDEVISWQFVKLHEIK